MKAAVYRSFGGPIIIENVPKPVAPPGGVLLKVKATGVCRSDWHGWKGHDSDIVEHGLPFVPGHEVSGVVVELGTGTRSVNIGDRVAVPFILSCGSCYACCDLNRPTVCNDQNQPGFTQWGSFAEYLAVPRADRNLRVIPPEVSFIEAAALGCRFTTAYRAVMQQGRLKSSDTLAVFGCGGLGLSCIMLAASNGNENIIAADVSEDALAKAKELGATHTIHILPQDTNDQVQKQVLQLTAHTDGADVTVDAAGFASSCENAIWCTRRAGRMVQVGLPIGGPSPIVPMGLIAAKEIEIIGSHGFEADTLPELLKLVADQKLKPAELVERIVTLEEGARAIQTMDQGSPLGMTVVEQFNEIKCRL
uniref:Enoyl reductase (ER) domain-containing protein n=1 Tax=Fibrocapsa japonica TaxID=94617 RepID=A0A7S2V035_9STRA